MTSYKYTEIQPEDYLTFLEEEEDEKQQREWLAANELVEERALRDPKWMELYAESDFREQDVFVSSYDHRNKYAPSKVGQSIQAEKKKYEKVPCHVIDLGLLDREILLEVAPILADEGLITRIRGVPALDGNEVQAFKLAFKTYRNWYRGGVFKGTVMEEARAAARRLKPMQWRDYLDLTYLRDKAESGNPKHWLFKPKETPTIKVLPALGDMHVLKPSRGTNKHWDIESASMCPGTLSVLHPKLGDEPVVNIPVSTGMEARATTDRTLHSAQVYATLVESRPKVPIKILLSGQSVQGIVRTVGIRQALESVAENAYAEPGCDRAKLRSVLKSCSVYVDGKHIENQYRVTRGSIVEFKVLGLGGMPKPKKNKQKQQSTPKKQQPKVTVNQLTQALKALKTPTQKKRVPAMKMPQFRVGRVGNSVYELALRNPFAAGADGVRCPAMSGYETRVQKFHGSISMTTDAGGGFEAIFLASPVTTLYTRTGSFTASTGWSKTGTTSKAGGFVTDSNLQTVYANMRTVVAGFRLRNMQAVGTCAGKFIIVPIIVQKDQVPSFTLVNNTTAGGQDTLVQNIWGGLGLNAIGTTNSLAGGALGLPGATQVLIDQTIGRDFEFVSRPMTYDAFSFKATINSSLTDGTVAQLDEADYFTTATGLVTNVGAMEGAMCAQGFMGFYVYCTNGPVSTNVLELEVVLHAEGQPTMNATTGYGVSTGTAPPSVEPSLVLNSTRNLGWYGFAEQTFAGVADGFRGYMANQGRQLLSEFVNPRRQRRYRSIGYY